jgi:hypothetical protein
MATYNLRHFSHAEALKHIAREHLIALLAPHAGFFSGRGVAIPSAASRQSIDYEGLVKTLMTPDIDTPKDLADALFFINEMATTEGMACLLEEAERLKIDIIGAPAPTPADVALQMWLKNRDVLERKHAEQFLTNLRSFESYQTTLSPVPPFTLPSAATLKALEGDLNGWFEQKNRGRNSRVFVFPRGSAVLFLVRHGDPYKREGTIAEGGESSSVYYWPEKFDVLVCVPAEGEIRVHAGSKGERTLCRTVFGRHLFGSDDFFASDRRYTLEPLREKGEAALACGDVDGMESVVLTEVQFFWGGEQKEKEVRKAENIFAAYAAREAHMPTKAPIIKASFRVVFSDSKTARTVTIRTPNVAQYTRDSDSGIIEKWLALRGFVVQQKAQAHEDAA